MDTQMQQHAESIISHTQALMTETATLNVAQIKYLEKISRNTREFLDVFGRLDKMPLPDLVSVLNHDIRNVITPIVGYAELLDMQVVGELTSQQQSKIKSVCQDAEQLRDALDMLLARMRRQQTSQGDI